MSTFKTRSISVDSEDLLEEFERDASELSLEDELADELTDELTDELEDHGDGKINISTINTVSNQLDDSVRKIDIWITNKGRKKITAVEGLALYPEFDTDEKFNPLLSFFKKSGCGARIIKQSRNAKAKINFVNKNAKIVSLNGNHVAALKDYLIKVCKINPKEIYLHN